MPSDDLGRAYLKYATTILFSLISIGALIGVPLTAMTTAFTRSSV